MNIVFDKSLQSPSFAPAGSFDESKINLECSFAPGTYVRLKSENKSDEILNWAFIECDCKEKIETLLNSNNFSNFINTNTLHSIIDNNKQQTNYNASYENDILSFSLPISRANEPTEDILEYKYYIVVFAYSMDKALPSLQDPYIVIDMSFRVGVGKDDEVRESALESTAKKIIETDYILSVEGAVEFLKACQGIKGKKLGDWNFYTMYPQLAGKIAYIYYRFDLANEEFIKSVKDGEEYLKQRNYFYQAALEVYLKDSYENGNYKMAFEKFKEGMGEFKTIKDFLYALAQKLNIKKEDMSKISTTNVESGDLGNYNKINHSLNIGLFKHSLDNASFINFIDTIIHEFRHFYIHRVRKNSQNSIEKLIYFNMEYFYILSKFYVIFNAYDKQCLLFDSVECGTGKCYSNETYYESRKKGRKKEEINQTYSPLYFIQPNEIDARIVAYYFRKEIHLQ